MSNVASGGDRGRSQEDQWMAFCSRVYSTAPFESIISDVLKEKTEERR